MIFLESQFLDRDNNLNLIRAIAAIAAISGYLIAMSFQNSESRLSFVLARFLRLFPALFVNVLFTVFFIGIITTTLPVKDYLFHSETLKFIIKNISLIKLQFTLPGVFTDHPYPTVLGSIWTLPHEVLCYLGLFIIGIGKFLDKRVAFIFILGIYGFLYVLIQLKPESNYLIFQLSNLSLPFMIGVSLYVWRSQVPLTIWVVIGMISLTIISFKSIFYIPIFMLCIAYSTLYIAQLPLNILKPYNHLGDYSYGIYIYAFPLQGFSIWLFKEQTAIFNILISFAMTIFFAVLSWHLIEKPALKSKKIILKKIQSFKRHILF